MTAGRPITAADVAEAWQLKPPGLPMDGDLVADFLNRIARGAPERGDDELPVEDYTTWTQVPATVTHGSGVPAPMIDQDDVPGGSLPAMPPEVTEALTWFARRNRYGTDPEDWIADQGDGQRHAATVVRWLVSLSNGHSDTGERAASEQDDPRSGNGGNAGACPACAGGEPHEPWTDEDAENVETALRAADADQAGHWPTVAGWLACEVRRLRAARGAQT